MQQKPTDVLEKLITYAVFKSAARMGRPGKPGELVERLEPEDREILQGLTSEDTRKMRFYPT